MMSFITPTVLTVIIRLRTMSRSWAWSLLLPSVVLLLGWPWNWLVIKLSVCGLKTTLLPLLNWFVITSFELRCVVKLCSVMNVCNLWWWCLIMYYLGCLLVESRSFEASSDYQVYMGSCPLAWLLSWSLIHLNSYKLDGSVTAGIGARLSI